MPQKPKPVHRINTSEYIALKGRVGAAEGKPLQGSCVQRMSHLLQATFEACNEGSLLCSASSGVQSLSSWAPQRSGRGMRNDMAR